LQEVLDGKAKNRKEEPDRGDSLVRKNTQRRAQHHDDAELPKKPNRGNSLDKRNTQRGSDIQESFVEGSYSQRKAKAAAMPTYRKMNFEEENVVDRSENKRKTTLDEYVDEGTSEQGFATNGAGWAKARTLSQISEDELGTDNDDVPVSFNTMGPTKEKRPAMTPRQKGRRDTAPAQLPVSTSGVSIHNHGSGTVVNKNIGNIEDSTISNVGNDNSENYFQPMPKPTYATKEKKPAMTPKQNVRRDTAPAHLQATTSGVSIHNYGSGNVGNSDVGNITNSIITDVGNNNSKNYFQARSKPTYPGYGH